MVFWLLSYHVIPQQNEGKLDELLKEVAETSPGPDTPNDDYDDTSPTTGMIIYVHNYKQHSIQRAP